MMSISFAIISIVLLNTRVEKGKNVRECQDCRNHNHSECLFRLQPSYVPWETPSFLLL